MTAPQPGVHLLTWMLLLLLQQGCLGDPPLRVFLLLKDKAEFCKTYSQIFDKFQSNSVIMLYENKSWNYLELRGNTLSNVSDVAKIQSFNNSITNPGRKVLYLTEEKSTSCSTSAKLAKNICSLFQQTPNQLITAVFPVHCTQSINGFKNIEKFEKERECLNRKIAIGVTKVKLYVGLDQSEKSSLQAEIQKNKRSSNVAVVYNAGSLEFFNGSAWVIPTSVENEFQQKIREAAMVTIFINSPSGRDNNGRFKVGGNNPGELARILKQVLNETEHPHKRVKVKIQAPLTPLKQNFTNDLVQNMNNNTYGKEPNVNLHLIVNESDPLFEDDLFFKFRERNLFNTNDNIVAIYDSNVWKFVEFTSKQLFKEVDPTKLQAINDTISQAEELYLQINNYGGFSGNENEWTVGGKNPEDLAGIIQRLFSDNSISAVGKRVEVKFYVCNVGTDQGQKYVNRFLKHVDPKVLFIKEVIAFKGWVCQCNREIACSEVWFLLKYNNNPQEVLGSLCMRILTQILNFFGIDWIDWYRKYIPYKPMKDRGTTRTIRQGNNTLSFPVEPAEEHQIHMLRSARNTGPKCNENTHP